MYEGDVVVPTKICMKTNMQINAPKPGRYRLLIVQEEPLLVVQERYVDIHQPGPFMETFEFDSEGLTGNLQFLVVHNEFPPPEDDLEKMFKEVIDIPHPSPFLCKVVCMNMSLLIERNFLAALYAYQVCLGISKWDSNNEHAEAVKNMRIASDSGIDVTTSHIILTSYEPKEGGERLVRRQM